MIKLPRNEPRTVDLMVRLGAVTQAQLAGAILDIDAIILGGRLPVDMAEMVIPPIPFFDQHGRSQSRPAPHLLAAEAPAAAAAMGAAFLLLQKLFH